MVMLFSCGAAPNTFIDLENNKALVVSSSSTPFVNIETTDTTSRNLTYVRSVVYTLNRSSYSNVTNSIEYQGYYYYWSTNETTDTDSLGDVTVKRAVKYSYLPLIESESIAVKSTTTTTTTFNFTGGEITKDVEVTYNLGGFFTDIEALKTASPDIYNMINHSTTRKYFVDTTVPETKSSSINSFTGFYYLEDR